MSDHLRNLGQDLNTEWNKTIQFIKKVAEQSIAKIENKNNKWYNEACCEAIKKRQVARENYNRSWNKNESVMCEKIRKNCKCVLQREKSFEWNTAKRKG